MKWWTAIWPRKSFKTSLSDFMFRKRGDRMIKEYNFGATMLLEIRRWNKLECWSIFKILFSAVHFRMLSLWYSWGSGWRRWCSTSLIHISSSMMLRYVTCKCRVHNVTPLTMSWLLSVHMADWQSRYKRHRSSELKYFQFLSIERFHIFS